MSRRFHKAWQKLGPWSSEGEKRGARVQLNLLTGAKTYQCFYSENNMLDSEAEWEKELVDTLEMDTNTFRPPEKIPSRVNLVNQEVCSVLHVLRSSLRAVSAALGVGYTFLPLVAVMLGARGIDAYYHPGAP